MDVKQLQTFLRVVDLGNFTKAAEELNYAQSTVTAQMKQLECELGVSLFDRIGRRVFLTSAGENFVPYAKKILDMLKYVRTAGKDPRNMRGSLRIGAIESLLFAKLTRVFDIYNEKYPNIIVQLKIDHVRELLGSLKQNRLDMVYASGRLVTDPELLCCYKRREELIFVAGAQHELASRKHVSLRDFLSFPRLDTEMTGICYQLMAELVSAYQLTINRFLVVDSTKAISEMLQHGSWVSFLPGYSVAKELEEGRLVRIDMDIEPVYYYSQILYHSNKWIAPFMQGMTDIIRQISPEE